jgi:hypothetical protein
MSRDDLQAVIALVKGHPRPTPTPTPTPTGTDGHRRRSVLRQEGRGRTGGPGAGQGPAYLAWRTDCDSPSSEPKEPVHDCPLDLSRTARAHSRQRDPAVHGAAGRSRAAGRRCRSVRCGPVATAHCLHLATAESAPLRSSPVSGRGSRGRRPVGGTISGRMGGPRPRHRAVALAPGLRRRHDRPFGAATRG